MAICAKCRKEIATGQEEVEKKGLLGKKRYHKECMPIDERHRTMSATCVNPDREHIPHL
jgi:hypothetical protein